MVKRVALAVGLACALTACTSGHCDPLESCDIREHSCQESVANVVACLRDSRAVTPPVKVVDADRFIDEQVSDAEAEPFGDDLRDHYRALHLFRLMPADIDSGALAYDEWDSVAAFFDPDTHRVTVLDRGWALDDPGSLILLAHELVHAQQSRETDDEFYATGDDSRDAYLASSAIVEGEATFYTDLATVYGYGFDPDDVDWSRVFRTSMGAAWVSGLQEPAIYERSVSAFSYAFGGAYLSEAYRDGGSAAVRKVTRHVPASTLAVIAGYRPDEAGPAVESLDDVAVPLLPETFQYLSSERAGAYLFENFLARTVVEEPYFFPDFEGTGVVGDSLSTFRVGADQVSAFWRVRLESESQAMALEKRFGAESGFVVKRDDRDVTIAAVSDDSLHEQIDADLTWGPAPEPEVDTDAELPPKAKRLVCRFHQLSL